MATVGRVLLWTVVLVAPGGFLLVPVLAATSRGGQRGTREQLSSMWGDVRRSFSKLQDHWSKP